MQITRADLYRLVIEEYAAEEGVVIGEDKVDDLLAWVKGGEKPAWAGEDDGSVPAPPDIPDPTATSSDTYPMEVPSDDAPESEYSGFQNDSGPGLESQLAALIQGMDPETVAALFQSVFEKIPGVELSEPGDEEETLYSPGAEGRPVAGFQLQELMKLIREVMREGDYHDMGDEDEMYDVLDSEDSEGFDNKSDVEIVNALWAVRMEKMIVLDGEGALANREEAIDTLKNTGSSVPPPDIDSMSWEEKATLMADR
jgi:hypothetical protein